MDNPVSVYIIPFSTIFPDTAGLFYFMFIVFIHFIQESGSPLLKYLQSCNDGVSLDFVQAVLRCGFDAAVKHQVYHNQIFKTVAGI